MRLLSPISTPHTTQAQAAAAGQVSVVFCTVMVRTGVPTAHSLSRRATTNKPTTKRTAEALIVLSHTYIAGDQDRI